VSYILDALKKAAEQRDVHAPAMQRLFRSDPEVADTPRWRMALLGVGASFAGAVVVSVLWLLWPAAPVVVPERADATPATARVRPETPPAAVQPPPPPAPPIVRTAPKPTPPAASATAAPVSPAPATAAPVKATAEERPPAPVVEVRRPATDPAPAADTQRAPVETPARPQPTPATPSVITALRPPAAGAAPAPTARGDLSSPMRLEVIVYSEERARRLAFINGRKYVEGDTLLDGARIQEIQPDAVVIIEDGRRVVLRP
jgi:hypothetical protein